MSKEQLPETPEQETPEEEATDGPACTDAPQKSDMKPKDVHAAHAMTACCILILCLCGCKSNTKRAENPNYESIRNCAKAAKKAENTTFKQTIAEETVVHKREQAKYDAIIAHPEKYADVVDLATGQNIPPAAVFVPDGTLPDIANPNTPQEFKIDPVTGAKSLNNNNKCKDGKCK